MKGKLVKMFILLQWWFTLLQTFYLGLTISNSPVIRTVHNSFARQQLFEFDPSAAQKNDDVFHFVGYIPIDGRLYELDGLKQGPIDLGAIPAEAEWTDIVRPIIEKRIQRYIFINFFS